MTIKEYVQLQKDLIRDEVSKLSVKPTIAIIQVNNDEASNAYVKGKLNDANNLGIIAKLIKLDESTSEEELFKLINDFVVKLGTVGAIDIDVYEVNGDYYISEVNPRFGGGHLLAYECGENFPKFIKNNLQNISNEKNIGNYEEYKYMIKHDSLYVI